MRIIADSSCDLFALKDLDFRTVPLTICTDERSFIDDESLDINEMMDYLEHYKGRSYTACPSSDAWLKAFEGSDEIIAFTVTSSLSGSCNAAHIAAEMYKEERKDAKISIIDSLSTGAEEIMLIRKTEKLIAEGHTFEEIDSYIRDYSKKTRLFFSFFSIHNLAENGRINKVIASSLNVLNIGICGTASQEGKIEVTGKARGEKKCLKFLFGQIKDAGYHGGKAVITHVQNGGAADELKKLILNEYPHADIEICVPRGLCTYYMERKGIVISVETK